MQQTDATTLLVRKNQSHRWAKINISFIFKKIKLSHSFLCSLFAQQTEGVKELKDWIRRILHLTFRSYHLHVSPMFLPTPVVQFTLLQTIKI